MQSNQEISKPISTGTFNVDGENYALIKSAARDLQRQLENISPSTNQGEMQ